MRHSWTNDANLKVERMWTCRRCGSLISSLQEPSALDGTMMTWLNNRKSYGIDLRIALSRGAVKATKVPADCDEAMVLNVMES